MDSGSSQTLTLNNIYNIISEELDIPNSLYQEAVEKYENLSSWLKQDHLEKYQSDAEIFPQGSIRLGTSIRPIRKEDDYDVDLVYRRDIRRDSITQQQLKDDVGNQLKHYIQFLENSDEEVPNLIEGRRCWTLQYSERFHLDVLPALPDDESETHNIRNIEDGLIITDKEVRAWQPSNPKGYADWFNEQQSVLLMEKRAILAKEADVDVENIPPERVPTPLRRAIQLLKRHRDIRYQGEPDDKPISIIISTLAAQSYQNEQDVYSALCALIPTMKDKIEIRDGIFWVANPVNPANPGENFADKWEANPQRAEAFFGWLHQVEEDLVRTSQQVGLHKIAESLELSYGKDVVQSSMEKYGSILDHQQQQGQLRMAKDTGVLGSVGIEVEKNTWYGK